MPTIKSERKDSNIFSYIHLLVYIYIYVYNKLGFIYYGRSGHVQDSITCHLITKVGIHYRAIYFLFSFAFETFFLNEQTQYVGSATSYSATNKWWKRGKKIEKKI